MQEAIRYYQPIVKKQAESILEVPAIVLANLCVSHIMISQNDEAEELMRKVCVVFFGEKVFFPSGCDARLGESNLQHHVDHPATTFSALLPVRRR